MRELDGYGIYGFFKSGTARVLSARERIDRINVFPVPDGDTGSNLAATLANAMDATVPTESAAETLCRIADAALDSARGNSGVIFAQFLSGLSEATRKARIETHEFAAAVSHAYSRARSAIADPREGTILSVIEDWAAALARRGGHAADFVDLVHSTREDLRRSLAETTDRLPELRAAGVIDAGALGFVEFVEGGHEYLRSGLPGEVPLVSLPTGLRAGEEVHAPGERPSWRYCAEAVIEFGGTEGLRETGSPAPDATALREAILRDAALRDALGQLGDSLIIASGQGRARVHLHTDRPAAFVEILSRFGRVRRQKIDDMRLQYRDVHGPHGRVALVTDSSCDLPGELLEIHGIHVVPLILSAGETEFLDKLSLEPERFWTLTEGKKAFPKTSQPSGSAFERLYDQLAPHYEAIVSIHLASALSGTCEAARRAAEDHGGGKVRVVDSRHLSGSLGLILLRAAEALETGMGAEELLTRLPAWSARARQYVSVSSLRYMVKGGRVSPLKGALARLLNLKPIVSVDETGKSVLYGKAFSERANQRKILALVRKLHAERPLRYYAIAHARAPEKARALATALERELGFPPRYLMEISSVVALNAGPGAVAFVGLPEDC